MKRVISIFAVFVLLLCLQTGAFAEELPTEELPSETPAEAPIEETPSEGTPTDGIITVSNLEELQAALSSAEDGDTIAIAQTITLKEVEVGTEKEITITRAAGFSIGPLLTLNDGVSLKGFYFQETEEERRTITIVNCKETGVTIEDCTFTGSGASSDCFIDIYGLRPGNEIPLTASITDCTFTNGGGCGISVNGSSTVVTISRCIFTKNQNRAISSEGIVTLSNSTITENHTNAGGGGLFSQGIVVISDCKIYGNTAQTASEFGADILSLGEISIADTTPETEGYYDVTTGQKINLPITQSTEAAKLTYMTDEAAAEYFAPKEPEEPAANPDTPTEPKDEEETGTDTPTASDPVAGEPESNPDESDEPDSEDIQQPPQEPQEPDGSDNGGDNDYTPPSRPKPVQPAIRPVEPISDPEPETVEELVCGGARIDTSRTVILLGYGDGLLHEEDGLTRAQLATILFRLLDNDSIARYVTNSNPFSDVAADAWYSLYVSTLHNAGVIYGVGDDLYSPDTRVTWAHIITILSRFVEPQGYDLEHISYTGWAAKAIETAVAHGWIEDSGDFSPDAIISRGQLVTLLNGILEQHRIE